MQDNSGAETVSVLCGCLTLQLFHKQNIGGVGKGKEEHVFLLLLLVHKTIWSVHLNSNPRDLLQQITCMAALHLVGKGGI